MTGGASGIGAAVVARLAAEGAARRARATRTATAPPRWPSAWAGTSIPSRPTCRPRRDVERSMRAAVERYGRIDLYHLNAGIAGAPRSAARGDGRRLRPRDGRQRARHLPRAPRGVPPVRRPGRASGSIVTSASICSFGGGADLVAYHTEQARDPRADALCGGLRRADRHPRERRRAGDRPDATCSASRRSPTAGASGTSARARLAPAATCRARRTRSPRSSPSC